MLKLLKYRGMGSQRDDRTSHCSQWDDMIKLIKVGSHVGWQDQQLQPAAVQLENHSMKFPQHIYTPNPFD